VLDVRGLPLCGDSVELLLDEAERLVADPIPKQVPEAPCEDPQAMDPADSQEAGAPLR